MKFGYTILYVQDVIATVEFYEVVFGFKRKYVHSDEPFAGQYAEMETGGTVLGFAAHELAKLNGAKLAAPLPVGQSPAMEVCFVTDDVRAAYKQAIEGGAESVGEPKERPWGQTVCHVRDNNGFLVELCTPVSDRK